MTDPMHSELRAIAAKILALGEDPASEEQMGPSVRLCLALSEQARRRARCAAMPEGWADQDGAWDLLLDLYVREAQKKDTSVTSACRATLLPMTTALRLIALLEKDELIVRRPDSVDGRRKLLNLSSMGVATVESALNAIALAEKKRGCISSGNS